MKEILWYVKYKVIEYHPVFERKMCRNIKRILNLKEDLTGRYKFKDDVMYIEVVHEYREKERVLCHSYSTLYKYLFLRMIPFITLTDKYKRMWKEVVYVSLRTEWVHEDDITCEEIYKCQRKKT